MNNACADCQKITSVFRCKVTNMAFWFRAISILLHSENDIARGACADCNIIVLSAISNYIARNQHAIFVLSYAYCSFSAVTRTLQHFSGLQFSKFTSSQLFSFRYVQNVLYALYHLCIIINISTFVIHEETQKIT